ncbi:nucleotidyltransferase family protein [Dyadobacter frigoris]|uniref:Nucleotidyltransferase domain-containing protein n=1 Tax=Dyadobacter frigoris TaxID=2576211 RepID=A0A4U6D867_9BACT|nr:nucleotidyltransferase domain-containing protein [Dyadobacter frigoris]TKT93659.1 nucleotidyltransferase domain-containing protein [Dyadobacter frigoris]
MTIQDLETILRREKIFDEFGLNRLAVFGSFARGEAYQDIDILLEQNMNYKIREQLKIKLQEILHTKVDLVPEKFADPIIVFRARKDLKYVTK